MQKTSNYNLNQWEPTDPIRREDFNADNAAIDAALKDLNTTLGSKATLTCGTYAGTGVVPLEVTVGFRPKFLAIFARLGSSNGEEIMNLIGMEGIMIRHPYGYGSSHTEYTSCTFTDTGFTIKERDNTGMNVSGKTYYYTALC